MSTEERQDRAANGSESRGSRNPFEAMQQAAAAAWQAPWQLVNRAGETQAALAEEWRRNLLNLAGQNAVFKTRVQKSGRVSIPDAEREALGIEEGDLVQVIVIPLAKAKKKE